MIIARAGRGEQSPRTRKEHDKAEEDRWARRPTGKNTENDEGLAESLPLTPRFGWLRGLDLNQRPLGYEGVGTVHRRRHRTKGAGSYAPRFRLVWSAVGRSTRKMHGKFVRSPRRLHGKAVRLQRARALGRKTQGDLVPQARASSHRRDRSPRRGRRPFPVSVRSPPMGDDCGGAHTIRRK